MTKSKTHTEEVQNIHFRSIHVLFHAYTHQFPILENRARARGWIKFKTAKRIKISNTKRKKELNKKKSQITYLKTIVRPTAEFHFASLIIERKPCDIDFTRRLKYSCASFFLKGVFVGWVCARKKQKETKKEREKERKSE